jgi:phage shock protein PspC (stress-responsive transcriptional regulator)
MSPEMLWDHDEETSMNVAEEIEKLQVLHARGALTDEEFARAKQAVLSGSPPALPAQGALTTGTDAAGTWLRRLARSRRDAWLGGVCGGLGEHTPLPSWCWRLLFVVLMLAFGIGLIPYIVMWICLPADPSAT